MHNIFKKRFHNKQQNDRNINKTNININQQNSNQFNNHLVLNQRKSSSPTLQRGQQSTQQSLSTTSSSTPQTSHSSVNSITTKSSNGSTVIQITNNPNQSQNSCNSFQNIEYLLSSPLYTTPMFDIPPPLPPKQKQKLRKAHPQTMQTTVSLPVQQSQQITGFFLILKRFLNFFNLFFDLKFKPFLYCISGHN
jgi:hypothetical protein